MVRLYLAILNSGWLRREISYTVLPQMQRMKDVEITFENPSKSWGHPISSNRNAITKRFLQTDCDFLLMIDDDIVPQHNPAELVHANKPIIASLAKVRQAARSINWVAYIKAPGVEDGYFPIDLDRVDSSVDLLTVDIVGTGCIMIRRDVLEKLKAPFHCEYDEDGIVIFGTDFAFCRKAAKAGYEILATPWRRCEHIKKNVGLCDITGWDDSDGVDRSNIKYEMPWGGWSIMQLDWRFIREIMEKEGVENVVEFGAGLSSLLMSERAAVVCYETDTKHADEIMAKGHSEANDLFIAIWDGTGEKTEIRRGAKYDLCFIDGPRQKISGGEIGREHAYRNAALLSDRIICHDAGTAENLNWQGKYLRKDFQLSGQSGHHQQRCNYWIRKTNASD